MVDLIVIGGGPAGVTAALRARELGAEVALIERGKLGGTCTNDGCAPTRVLAKAARLARDARQFASYGLEAPLPTVDFARLMDRTQQVIYTLQEKKQLIAHLESVGVTTYHGVGNAHFTDPHTIQLASGESLQADKFVICVGGSARRLGFPGSEMAYLHSDVWSFRKLPSSVVIVGGGATGCQLSSIFATFGSQVTLMDVAPRILLSEDEMVAETIRQSFEGQGIHIITGISGLERIDARDGLHHLTYTHNGSSQVIPAEAILLSVGWPANLDPLHLEAAGVERRGNYIAVDDYLRTTASHIYAAGDVTGKMMLVQSAGSQARAAVENALLSGDGTLVQHPLVPHGGFTDPEYASVGLTESQAQQRGACQVSVVPYADLDRAVIDGHTEGYCKLIVDTESHEVIGAHVVGEQAVETVQIVAAAMASHAKVETLAELELAYPTYSAVVGLAARELIRKLGLTPVAAEWRALKTIRGAEWERKDEGSIT
jgi:pyruvate/2-oxoglutarate dehydrogenase complex dihydrolipoamide dehydrogenase (E3) component